LLDRDNVGLSPMVVNQLRVICASSIKKVPASD
jgi:hypothetical protein